MIGLPTETYEDLDGIVDLAHRWFIYTIKFPRKKRKRFKRYCQHFLFVPKPFTPFQWQPQESIQDLQEKQDYLRRKLGIKTSNTIITMHRRVF